ncbi:MAG: ZIP family metal transporter [Bacillota bacterium]|nr:ZIP family metal transporter [Bacillota bacterium]
MIETLVTSLIAGLATAFGAFIVVAIGRPQEETLAMMLGGAAGIMIVVVLLDLIPSSLAYGSLLVAVLGFLSGVLILSILDKFFASFAKREKKRNSAYLRKMGYLIAIGIALHDLPEGIAIAVGYTAADKLGFSLTLAIGMHNIPEGMAVAAPLKMAGTAGWVIMLITLIVALFTPVGTLIGLILVSFSPQSMAYLLALAGGAMTYIVKYELLPEAKRRHPNYARLGVAVGMLLMVIISFLH